MADHPGEKRYFLPEFPGVQVTEIELAPGYEFGKPRGSEIDVFPKGKPEELGGTWVCRCSAGSGGCTLRVLGSVASCTEDGCRRCGWVVKVASDVFAGLLGQVFAREQSNGSIRLPAFPGVRITKVAVSDGYELGEPDGGQVKVFRPNNGAGEATVECVCANPGSPGQLCTVGKDKTGRLLTCSNNTCTDCSWEVTVPTKNFVGLLSDAFRASAV
jgi:hypothetical protein